MREDLTKTGYSHEDEYFYKANRELIEKRRAERAQEQAAAERGPHWMKCPKCSSELVERDFAGLIIDQRGSCQGMFFDAGEIDVLLKAKEPGTFLDRMKTLFR